MRKILLGTTAIIGAAVFAPTVAEAQEAPTVRIGGYFRAYYGNTQQTGRTVTGTIGSNSVTQLTGPGAGGTGATALPSSSAQSARLSKDDFSTDAEIQVFVNGKTANGLSYGAVIELQVDNNESTARPARRSLTSKTGVDVDEMWAFVSSPKYGTIRFGDEDGPIGGLMNSGIITNFGTGGIYGDWQDFVVRPNRTTTSPGDLGDNTKIIYLSPQFFGFDAGLSFALNEGEGGDTGCVADVAGVNCDSAYAASGVTGFGRGNGSLPGRTNEFQFAGRWRGNVAGIGLAATVGGMVSTAVRDISVTGTQRETLRDPYFYQAGLQASAYGFTVGGSYQYGNTRFFYIPTVKGDKEMSQWFVGGSYTAGPISVGGNFFSGQYAGGGLRTYSAATDTFTAGNPRGQRRWGYGFGANYRLAPGMDIVAEYVRHEVKTPGSDLDNQGNNGIQDRLKTSVFITGVRLAF